MNTQKTPTTQGQICKLNIPFPGEDPMETYILVDSSEDIAKNEMLQVVSITQLQRHMREPNTAPRITVKKEQLKVVAQDLTSFIESFNH